MVYSLLMPDLHHQPNLEFIGVQDLRTWQFKLESLGVKGSGV